MQTAIRVSDNNLAWLVPVWVGVSVISVVAVAIAPLAAFVLMISAFGLPHVIYEMRYVDERFGGRTSGRLLLLLGGLVGLIALGRVANGAHWVGGEILVPVELVLGSVLAGVAAWHMREHRWLGAVAGLVFAAGAVFQPILTFVAWAWIHNLTPLGFVAEIMQGEARRRWMMWLFLPFVVLPGLVATGVFHDAARWVLGSDAYLSVSLFGAGDRPLLSFLPPGSSDVYLFSAAVVAQAMHYVAVIVMMPALLAAHQGEAKPATLVRWPGWMTFGLVTGAVSLIGFAIYAVNYADARSAYSVAAAMHAWIELPVLLLALGQGFRTTRI